jgi:cystathionine gamma-synthase
MITTFVNPCIIQGFRLHLGHDIANRQMKMGYGAVLSVELENESQAMAVAGALRLAQRATSLGGTETLVEHQASIEPPWRVISQVQINHISRHSTK